MQKLILIQVASGVCEVRLASDSGTDVLFSGGRWDCRRYLHKLRLGIGWESVPAYCQKLGKRGRPGPLVEIPLA